MQNERAIKRTGRLAPLAQVALAALVAGSLLTFSTIAFRTAFDEPSRGRGVKVSSPHTEPAAPVVLPTPPKQAAVARVEDTGDVVAEIVATITPTTNDVDTEERRSSSKDKDKNRFSEPRVVLPGGDGDRNLSGFGPDDHDGDEGKSKGHGKSKGKHGKSHQKGRGHGHGHKDKGHGHNGHRHSKGRKH